MCFQSTRRLEDMHIRAYKALTQRWKDARWRPQTKVSLLCEDVSLLAADSRLPHSPLQISALSPLHHSSPLPDGYFSLLQPLMKHISMPLTLVELLCNVSFWMAPVSQFLIFRKRGHLEGLPFCRDLVGEVLASAGGCKGTNESLLRAFQPFATSGMHLIPAVWLAVMPRKAEETFDLLTVRRWINALIGYRLVKSIWAVVQSNASRHSLVDFRLRVAFLYYAWVSLTDSNHLDSPQPMPFHFQLLLTDECLQFNLSTGSREKHSLIA